MEKLPKISQKNWLRAIPLITLAFLCIYALPFSGSRINIKSFQCKLADYHRPESYERNKATLDRIVRDPVYRNECAIKLSGAIQIDTQVSDAASIKIEDDPKYWARFDKFEEYLHGAFPLFYQNTELHKVNTHGLVYIWQGSDSTLKPLVLMAHQDVVTVAENSLDKWEHPPFEGFYDGEYMYGRGTADCKELLVAHFEAAEQLMKSGFKPKRTVIYSFGFDEEIQGIRNKNAQFIEEKYGKDSVFAIIDEGGLSLKEYGDTTMAVPATAEKGYFVLKLQIETPGGHSSIPPEMTGISYMGELISFINRDPFHPHFTEVNPAYEQYTCLAEHSDFLSNTLRKDVLQASSKHAAAKRVANYLNQFRNTSFSVRTMQALDVISGGSKVNSLPELTELTINCRVAMEETANSTIEKYLNDARIISDRYGLGLIVRDKDLTETVVDPPTDAGTITVYAEEYFEASPITPTGDERWDVLAGTIRHVYEEIVWPEKYVLGDKSPIIVSPGISSGNTDTKWYWNLTDHIYRYRPGEIPGVLSGEHGINEWIKFDSFLQIIAFYFEYIQSIDELA